MNGNGSGHHVELQSVIANLSDTFQTILAENSVLWSIIKTYAVVYSLMRFRGTVAQAESMFIREYLRTYGMPVPTQELDCHYYVNRFPKAGHNAPGNLLYYHGSPFHSDESVVLCLGYGYAIICNPVKYQECISDRSVYAGFGLDIISEDKLSRVLSYHKPVTL